MTKDAKVQKAGVKVELKSTVLQKRETQFTVITGVAVQDFGSIAERIQQVADTKKE